MWKATKSKSPTIAAVLAEHIQGLPSVTARGRADYERDARLHINPYLGTIPVDTITADMVKHWLRTLAGTSLSDKTIANMHGLLSSAVDTAHKAGHRPDNPCHGLRMPRRSEHSAVEMVFLTHGQWAALDTELGQVCDGYYQLLFRTLAGTGARWGEAAALQVGDLTFTSKPPTVRIARALRRDENSRPYIGPTKTRRSRRTISLPEKLAGELHAEVKGQAPTARVFNGHTGAPLHHSNIRLRAWLPAVQEAMNAETYGSDALTVIPRIHDLRHSHASWLFEAGVDILTVQRRLGHESITTTADRYGHLMPGQQIAAAAALNGVFG
jgi:integrase